VPYRETLLPLLSLRRLLGLEQGAASAPKVIVTTVGGALVGLVADRMQAIIPADPALIEPIPAVLAARTGGEARIGSIYRGDSERGLVSILAPERLFREDVMQRLGTGSAGLGTRDEGVAEANAEGIRFIVFRLGDDEFGLPVEAVDEVARVPDKVTRVPRTPAFLEGVVNLRGDVLPVIDGRRRFDMPPAEVAERRRLLVVRSERHRAGLIVDAVLGISFATRDAIEPAPDVTGEATRLVQGVVNLEAEGRIVLLLEPADLLTRTERGFIDALAGEAEA
jgi:purine-binding chemotaxis protein CheW